MIEIQMTQAELEGFMNGGEWSLYEEIGFDRYGDVDSGRMTVLINGDPALVELEIIQPRCSCCRNDPDAIDFSITLVVRTKA
jgi:hypothetical protein